MIMLNSEYSGFMKLLIFTVAACCLLLAFSGTAISAEKPKAYNTVEKSKAGKVSSIEYYRNKKLLEKTIRDLEAYGVMLKYIDDHKNDNNRLLLLEETGKYIDSYVDPLLNNNLIYAPATFDLAATLTFLKAYVKFESGEHKEYLRIIKDMEKKYGKRHLGIAFSPSTENFKTIGEGIIMFGKMAP